MKIILTWNTSTHSWRIKNEMAIVLLHPENIDAGIKALESGGAEIVSSKEIYGL